MVDHTTQDEQNSSDVLVIRVKRIHFIIALVAIVCYAGGFLTHSMMTVSPAVVVAQQAQEELVPEEDANADVAPPQERDVPTRLIVDHDNDPAIGPANAPITIIEFSDFQCPYCRQFSDQTLHQLITAYGDQIRFVYRDFPLSSIHAEAQKAAEAAECANDQGEFWSMHDRLFAGLQEWSRNPKSLDVFTQYAGEFDLDMDQFAECLNTGKYTEEVLADYQAGQAAGVTGTPSFFVNGRTLRGAVPLSMFQSIIDSELSQMES